MRRKLRLLWVLSLLFAGCGQKADPASCPADQDNGCVDATLSYDKGIGALLTQRCSPCHAAGGVEATNLLTDYSHAFQERMGIGAEVVTCSMPPEGAPQLSAGERVQILGWLSCNAPK